jgi:murein DD-endopeptidase MepM/ murein hydrolase activator NlpD
VRGAFVAILAAGLTLGVLLVSASGAERTARARAQAMAAAGDTGPQFEVGARGSGDEQRRSGPITVRGLRIGTAETGARTSIAGGEAVAHAYAAARSVDVFDGLVTAWGVRRESEAPGEPTGRVSGLRIDGRMIGEVLGEETFELPGDAGTVEVNRDGIGLRVVLRQPTRGFEAGSEIRVAVAVASARDAEPAAPVATPTPAPAPEKPRKRRAKKDVKRQAAPAVKRRLTAGGFAFPVYGGADTADDFGGPRQIGPHQGNDIFAEFGAPVVAVTDGTVSKVGTLPISGNRLWLTTPGGDAFFYAHMSAFSTAAVDGAQVKAGTVLGFVGNTGDAEPTPPHLHFEVHPGGEAQDAVDPHPILLAWQGRVDVAPGAWLQQAGADTAERPGALVAVRDFIAE